MVQSTPSFPLRKLPTEIRAMIWMELVVSDEPIYLDMTLNATADEASSEPRWYSSRWRSIHSVGSPSSPYDVDDMGVVDKGPRRSVLEITMTCYELYNEITPIYYSKNDFRLSIPAWSYLARKAGPLVMQALRPFIDDIGKDNFFAIKHLGLNLDINKEDAFYLGYGKDARGPASIHCLLVALQDLSVGQRREVNFYQDEEIMMQLQAGQKCLVLASEGHYLMDYSASKNRIERQRIHARRRRVEQRRRRRVQEWAVEHAVCQSLWLEDQAPVSGGDQSRLERN